MQNGLLVEKKKPSIFSVLKYPFTEFPWKKSYDKLSVLKSRDITLPTKVHIVKAMAFPVVMCRCENWTIKKAEHSRIDVFKLWCWRRALESPFYSKEIKPVNHKGNQPWKFAGRTDAEAAAPVVWLSDVKGWLMEKDPDAGKDWRQEKGVTEDEMVGWRHWLSGRGFEQALGDSEGQENLVCYSSWGCRVKYDLVAEQEQQ